MKNIKITRTGSGRFQANINEGATLWLDVDFLNKDEQPQAPNQLFYRIDRLNGEEVKGWTEVSSPGESEEIVILPAENIVSDDHYDNEETRVVTLHILFGGGEQRYDTFRYKLKRLINVPREA